MVGFEWGLVEVVFWLLEHRLITPPAWFAVLELGDEPASLFLVFPSESEFGAGFVSLGWECGVGGGGVVVVGELFRDVDASVFACGASDPYFGGLFPVDAFDGVVDEVVDFGLLVEPVPYSA